MELLDRYLNAVRFWLPAGQQEDIVAELSEDIGSQIEERESALGRKLEEADVAALLKERGHPLLMAERYLPQRSLIGPVLYPSYLVVLKMVVLWILVPVFLLIVGPVTLMTAADPVGASIRTLWNLAMASVFAVGVITVVFGILERRPLKELEDWDPRRLPRLPVRKTAPDTAPATSRVTAIAELVFGVICTGVCLQAIPYRLGFDLDAIHVAPAPVWDIVFWLVLLSCVAGVARGWAGLVLPSLVRLRAAIRMGTDGIVLIGIGILAKAGTWMALTAPGLSAASLAEATRWGNVGMEIALASAAIVTLVDAGIEARRFFRARVSTPAASAVII